MAIMEKLLKGILSIREFKSHADDDFVDRLSRKFTPLVIVLFSTLVSVKQYVGDPINCWCPAQFTSSHIEYANTVCWVSDTYYVPFEQPMPQPTEKRLMISYYQWVPLLLMCQACLFAVPCLLWRFLNRRSGMNLHAVVEAAQSCQTSIYHETRNKALRYMVMQVDSYLSIRRDTRSGCYWRLKRMAAKYCCLVYGKLYGNYLTSFFLFSKLLYLSNAVGQLFLLDAFLGMDTTYHLYGVRALLRFMKGEDWSLSHRFPRVTLCDFQVRQQTNVHRYTVQCVLPINLFNEKIFIFLWFWLFFLLIAILANMAYWIQKSILPGMQVAYIKKQLRSMDLGKRELKNVKKFTESYLRRDGLLIVRLISKNAGDMIAAEMLFGLWANHNPEACQMAEPPPPPGRRHNARNLSQDVV